MSHGPTRRGLLALPAAGLAAGAAQGQAQAQDFTPIRARLAGLRLGANLERWFPIARDNQPRRLGRGWWREFRAAGFDHVRMFLPEVAKTGAGMEIPAMFHQAAEDAVAAGLPVLLGMADMWYQNAPWETSEWAAMRARAEYFAARTDPGQVVLAALNEPAFDNAANWLPLRDRLLDTMRRAAPRHLLMWGGWEWCSARSLLDCPPPADPGTVAEVHDYEGGDAAAVTARFGPVAAWRDRHRLPVLVTELGGAKGHETDRAAWAADLARVLPVLRDLGLPANLWSYSHGGWWRIQANEDATPRPGLLPRRR